MAQLRLKVLLNHGRRGVPIDKLAVIAADLERFIMALADQAGATVQHGDLIAVDFQNEGSVSCVIEAPTQHPKRVVRAYHSIAHATFTAGRRGRRATRAQRRPSDAVLAAFAAVADHIDADESVRFTLPDGAKRVRETWFDLDRPTASRIVAELQPRKAETLETFASAQGVIHSLWVEPERPYFNLRDLMTGILVKCVFEPHLRRSVLDAIEKQGTIVHVSGIATWKPGGREIEMMRVQSLAQYPELSDSDFDSLFGCAPGITGGLTAAEFIRRHRGDD